MPWVRTPIIGTGTDPDPYRPDGLEEFTAHIRCNLRTGVPIDGDAVCYTPSVENEGITVITREEAFQEIKKRDPNATPERIKEFESKPRTGLARSMWNWVRGSRLFRDQRGLVVLKDFDGEDGDSLGDDWTEIAGDIDRVSGKAQSVSIGAQAVARLDIDFQTDHYCQASVDASNGSGASVGLVVRKDNSATQTFYFGQANYSNSLSQIRKTINGSETTLAQVSRTLTPGVPTLLRLQANGPDLVLFVDGQEEVTASDSDIGSGTRCGLRCFKNTSGFFTWDNFEASDLKIDTPTIDPDGGEFDEPVEVTLSTTPADATIYYTLDGSDPDEESTEYTAPFMLEESATVKAIAIKTGLINSEIASAEFTVESALVASLNNTVPCYETDSGPNVVECYVEESGQHVPIRKISQGPNVVPIHIGQAGPNKVPIKEYL